MDDCQGNNSAGRKEKHGCLGTMLVWFLPLVALGMILLVGCGLLAAVGVASLDSEIGKSDIREKVVREGDKTRRVAVIRITGEIDGNGNHLFGEGTAHEVTKKIHAAVNDKTVRAVVFDVDSPGGGLTASDVIYNEVKALKAAGKHPIASVGGLAASGGYYAIAPCERIFMQPTGMVGSFGVIMTHFEVTELLQKIGVKINPVKSTDGKDIGSPFRPMTPAEKKFFEKILNTFHQRFVDIIAEGRHLDREKVIKLATGEVFATKEALANGLIDETGYFDAALAYAATAAGVPANEPEVILYEDKIPLSRWLESLSERSWTGKLLGGWALAAKWLAH